MHARRQVAVFSFVHESRRKIRLFVATRRRMQLINALTSTLASTARGWRGTKAARTSRQPEKMLKLYEYEGCPFCRLVREALTELDLDAIIHPCPRGGTRWRPEAERIGGRAQFPLLVDDNTGDVLYESADIIAHLRQHYGTGRRREAKAPGFGAQLGANAASALRGFAGTSARGGKVDAPGQPLELYSFESSPFSRIVRETLCELELAYVLRNMGKAVNADMGPPWVREKFFADTPVEGRNRKRMKEETGRLQVPYLIDPNTDTRLYESADIVRYLRTAYGG
jgi:glutathione S-transferase